MYIYKTELSKTSPIPTQVDFLRAAHRRELLRTGKEQSLYRNLEQGAQGEQHVMDMLKKYGREHWIILQNLWLDQYGVYENDVVLLTNFTYYTFEVKNYEGVFEYRDGRCLINGRKWKENSVHQAQKALTNLQDICGAINRSISVKGALLMVGEHNEVRIHSPVDGIEVVPRNQFKHFIQQIAREEEAQYHKVLNSRPVLDHFEKNETLNPFGPLKSYSPEEVLAGRCGIYCKTCGSYEVVSSRKFVTCKNGHEELRREAVLRTIHEFGVLTFQHDFMTRRDLQAFTGNQVSAPYLVNLLNQYFTKVQHGKYAKYLNKKALY